ncbi:MAG: AraC family transcriptional regulator [Firmicutes bacterium]|nr:AraC family transcriptional regulator [Bacillota bacterium]
MIRQGIGIMNFIRWIDKRSFCFKQLLSLRQSIIFSWLLSYGLVLLIPVIFTGFIYLKTVKVVENEINNSNLLLLKKIQQQMDGLLTNARRTVQEITFDAKVQDFLRLAPGHTAAPYERYLLVRNLGRYLVLNNSVDNFYIYFKKLDLVVSPDSSNDSHSFFRAYFDYSGRGYSEWAKLLAGNYQGEFFVPDRYGNGGGNQTITYIQTLPFRFGENSAANIVVTLKGSWFQEDARDIRALNQGTILVLNQQNQILASSQAVPGASELGRLKFPVAPNGSPAPAIRQRLNRQTVIVSYIVSQVSEWRYLVYVPEGVFWEKAAYVRRLALISLAVCLFIGGFIVYLALKKNYNPLEKLIHSLEKYQGANYDKKNNEYSFIEQAIDKAYTDLEKVDGILAQQNKVLRMHFLARLLKGGCGEERDLRARLALHNIRFVSDNFAVLAFYIDDFAAIDGAPGNCTGGATETGVSYGAGPPEKFTLQEDYKRVQTVVMNVISGLITPPNLGFVIEVEDLLACLLNFAPENLAGAADELSRIAGRAKSLLEEEFNIRIFTSASNLHQNLAGIGEAFQEALQAMEYARLLGIEDLLRYEDLRGLSTGGCSMGGYYYPLEKEQQLMNCIKTGDQLRAKLTLEEIFKNNFEKSILPPKTARCLVFNLAGTMMKIINEMNEAGDSKYHRFLEKVNPVERLFACETIVRMRQEIISIAEIFCDYARQKNREKNKKRGNMAESRLKDQVMEYVRNNFRDPNLGISFLADRFKVHPVYLSRIFREQSGESLMDYINRIRLKQAKQLFKNESDSLDEVARAVGYGNTRTFTRVFKKYEGVTPGRYKDSG